MQLLIVVCMCAAERYGWVQSAQIWRVSVHKRRRKQLRANAGGETQRYTGHFSGKRLSRDIYD